MCGIGSAQGSGPVNPADAGMNLRGGGVGGLAPEVYTSEGMGMPPGEQFVRRMVANHIALPTPPRMVGVGTPNGIPIPPRAQVRRFRPMGSPAEPVDGNFDPAMAQRFAPMPPTAGMGRVGGMGGGVNGLPPGTYDPRIATAPVAQPPAPLPPMAPYAPTAAPRPGGGVNGLPPGTYDQRGAAPMPPAKPAVPGAGGALGSRVKLPDGRMGVIAAPGLVLPDGDTDGRLVGYGPGPSGGLLAALFGG